MAVLRIVVLMMFLGSLCESARVNADNIDYESLLSMLDEYEAENNEVSSSSFDQHEKEEERRAGAGVQFSISKPSVGTLLNPQVEVLSLVESFLRLKGEMASRINALINDNFHLFKRVYNLFMNKISTLHSFTLAGVRCLRKIVEFAVGVISSWEIAKPSVAFGFNNY